MSGDVTKGDRCAPPGNRGSQEAHVVCVCLTRNVRASAASTYNKPTAREYQHSTNNPSYATLQRSMGVIACPRPVCKVKMSYSRRSFALSLLFFSLLRSFPRQAQLAFALTIRCLYRLGVAAGIMNPLRARGVRHLSRVYERVNGRRNSSRARWSTIMNSRFSPPAFMHTHAYLTGSLTALGGVSGDKWRAGEGGLQILLFVRL